MPTAATSAATDIPPQQTLFGHPVGLYTLFFAEMWERFSYYGMRALLLFYMTKGFLEYSDSSANTIYGSYTALVYMTPFFGGMLADRLIGQRRAVVLGGLLMACGHLLLTVENAWAFYMALAFLITGNGFFKPNISTMVGSLYPPGHTRRDGGYTIFYMGVNLGAAFAPLICGYIGETYGHHYGFGLATLGMLTGVAIFTAPVLLTQCMIGVGSVAGAIALMVFKPEGFWPTLINTFVALALLVSASIAMIALARGGLPKQVGQPANWDNFAAPGPAGLPKSWCVYTGALLCVPILGLFVSGFSLVRAGKPLMLLPESFVEKISTSEFKLVRGLATVVEEVSRPAGLILMLSGVIATVYLLREAFRLSKVPRERMFVALTLTFTSILFWAFFEQAGSSINHFTDRNVDRVGAGRVITSADVDSTLRLQPTQEQFGYYNGESLFTLTNLTELRDEQKQSPDFEIDWLVSESNVGMVVAERSSEVPASMFQSINAVYILLFGLPFTLLWTWLATRRKEPGAPLKFVFGLLQLGLGFGALWYGAQHSDSRGMVGLIWLYLGYLLHTTGELCLSPVGLSMISRLTPKQLVSTMMGAWFLATAFSQYVGGIIAQFANVNTDSAGALPSPKDTVRIYGDVYGFGAAALLVGAFLLLLFVPLLNRWMHRELPEQAA